MSSFSFDFGDLDQVAAELGAEPAKARREAREAGIQVGRKVKSKAQADAPRDRPWLATQGIRQKTWGDQGGSHTDIFTVPDPRGRPVGFFVEYGTSDTPPQPFLTTQLGWASGEFAEEILRRIDPLGGGA